MTRMILRAAVLSLSAASLAACTTPAYPTRSGYVRPSPVRPQYPIAPVQAAQATPAPVPQTAPAGMPQEPAPAPVEAQSLPLISASPNTATPPAPLPAVKPAVVAQPKPVVVRMLATGKVEPAKGMFRVYQVVKGDHLDAIARDLDITRAVLVEANHLKSPFEINPGQRLKVPVEKVYVVQSGDTITVVARRFSVRPLDLADLNALSLRARLQAGDKLALPSTITDQGPIRQTSADVAAAYIPIARSRHRDTAAYNPSPAALAAADRRTSQPAETATGLTRPEVIAAGRGRFIWPVRGTVITQFGITGDGRRIDGIDIRAPQGEPVLSASAGDVVYAGNQVPGFGNLVLVKHADGWVTAYAHLDRITVQMKQTIDQGQKLGVVGISGGVTEPQLHFEVRFAPSQTEKARPVDPLLVLPKDTQ